MIFNSNSPIMSTGMCNISQVQWTETSFRISPFKPHMTLFKTMWKVTSVLTFTCQMAYMLKIGRANPWLVNTRSGLPGKVQADCKGAKEGIQFTNNVLFSEMCGFEYMCAVWKLVFIIHIF